MSTESLLYCPQCLNNLGKLIRYAITRKYCVVCESEKLVGFVLAQDRTPTISEVLSDRAASNWLKTSLGSALMRDPVDAANDAEVMARVLSARCQKLLEGLVGSR